MSPEERQAEGPRIQALRDRGHRRDRRPQGDARARRARRAARLRDARHVAAGRRRRASGSVHPVSQVMDELAEIFADLGFAVATGPEIEDDWHNFTALNIPDDASGAGDARHLLLRPTMRRRRARKMLLRTHTSPVQIRTMLTTPPPIRIIAPGRTYRSDSDATHTPMFHQVEGLVIDKGHHARPSQMDARDLREGLFRARRHRAAPAPELFPLHRAVGGGRCRLHAGQGQARDRRRRARRLDGDPWLAAWSTPR